MATDFSASDCAHPDCDGWIMHSVQARQLDSGTWIPECPICGDLPVIGSAGTAETAIALARGHESHVRCDGRCAGVAL